MKGWEILSIKEMKKEKNELFAPSEYGIVSNGIDFLV